MTLAGIRATWTTESGSARRLLQFFFFTLGLFGVAVALVAFVPEYANFAAGKFPIAWVLHIHGALMSAWLATFVAQAWLASTGRIELHRRFGPYGIALGIVVWASMVFVELRLLIAHPLPTDDAGYDELLQGVYAYLTFLALLLWAAYERRRPAWHKRLMLITAFLALGAPIERMEWLPELGVGYVWASMIWLDLCLTIPLVAYDFISAKHLHRATVLGLSLMLSAQSVLFLAWETAFWRHFAFIAAHAVRSHFGGG